MSNPKVFISYSWSSEEHEAWVVNFAEQLMQAGVNTVFDKWDLQPTADAYDFMERMVNDPTIDKVLIICDEVYTRKANARDGSGVSTETQIISPAIYKGTSKDKFVAIVTERDAAGNAFVPTYYSSKIYIDFSSPGKQSESFEELIRYIYGQPRYKRPQLGSAPGYLSNPDSPSMGTTLSFNRALSALKDGKPFAEGAVEEYLTTFHNNLSLFKITFIEADDVAKLNLTSNSLISLLPYRNELVQIFETVARYSPTSNYTQRIHRFFEGYLDYIFPQLSQHYNDWDFDNFKFFGREAFLYYVAVMIKHERFDELADFLSRTYFVKTEQPRYRNSITDYSVFSWIHNSLDYKNKIEKHGKLSLSASLLHDRAGVAGITFSDLMQADIVLYVRALINRNIAPDEPFFRWYPDTCVYLSHHADTLEIFARAKSAKYFEKIRPLLGGWESGQLDAMITELSGSDALPRYGWQTLPLKDLLGINKLSTRP